MVELGKIDRAQLMDMVQTYPWFAAARAMVCLDLTRSGDTDAARGFFAESLPHLPDGIHVLRQMHGMQSGDYRDSKLVINPPAPKEKPRVVAAGMDFFSREDYDTERREEDAAISRIAVVDYSAPAPENSAKDGSDDILLISETLAEIYASQGYPEQAKEIYHKLSLESPEKSAYFASLIDNLNS